LGKKANNVIKSSNLDYVRNLCLKNIQDLLKRCASNGRQQQLSLLLLLIYLPETAKHCDKNAAAIADSSTDWLFFADFIHS